MKKKDLLKLNILLLSGLLLTSCSKKNKNTGLYYMKEEQGSIEIDGRIKYENMRNYKFIALYNYKTNEINYYLVSKKMRRGFETNEHIYYDIFTGKEIFREEIEEIEEPTEEKIESKEIYKTYEYNVEDYLIENNKIKNTYSEYDAKKIIEDLKSQYESLSTQKSLKLKKN